MLRSLARYALALEALAGCGVKIARDIALAHASQLGGADSLGMRPQLGPHGRRIALARLTIVGHTGERNRTTRRLYRAAKACAQQGSRLKRHALATEARRQRGQRPLFV